MMHAYEIMLVWRMVLWLGCLEVIIGAG